MKYKKGEMKLSFVSVVAKEKFISIMCDGRKTSGTGEVIEERVKKFERIKDKYYVAFAGTYDLCMNVVEEVKELIESNNSIESVIELTSDKLNQLKYDEKIHKVLVSLGGVTEDGKIIISQMSNNPNINFEKYYLNGSETKYIFLHNTDNDVFNLDEEFKLICENTKATSQTKLIRAQKILNDKIADIDSMVNKIEQKMIIKA
jgi:20S proteasome alpha/beta subunit